MTSRVLIVDFSSDSRRVPCGRNIAAALPSDARIELLRAERLSARPAVSTKRGPDLAL